MATDEETKSHVEHCWARIKPNSPIYAFLLSDIEIVHASKGLQRLFDWAGGLAISSWDLREKSGVSTDIHVTYVSSAKEGDTIEVEGKASKVGGTLAFTSMVISKVVDGIAGPVIATGNHTKYVKI
ncbi:hypothetical protein C8J57DRAFT_1266941 [Mycena rebaudengoi]|nr:hypothetical protein C8J57DRAFT_1266941 [Mycena rebaudengoi]